MVVIARIRSILSSGRCQRDFGFHSRLGQSDDVASQTGPATCPPDYWRETRRPFCNLIFLLPLLLIYEIGVAFISGSHGESIRNGADAWMRVWLAQTGIAAVWLPPILLLGTLLGWHLSTRQRWRMTWETFAGMAAESLLYAFVLIMLGQLTDYGFRHTTIATFNVELPLAGNGCLVRLVTFMGAGIYEEYLFRLCFLSAAYQAFRITLIPKGWAIAGTIVTSSIFFSLAHYLGPTNGGPMLSVLAEAVARVQTSRELWFGFVFRTLAGTFFAALYFLRGFGITVGAHATYDVVIGLVLVNEL